LRVYLYQFYIFYKISKTPFKKYEVSVTILLEQYKKAGKTTFALPLKRNELEKAIPLACKLKHPANDAKRITIG
jgi:hypothetical protein